CGTASRRRATSISSRNNASEKRARPNGHGDRLMKSSACTKNLPDHPLHGAINRGPVPRSRLWQPRRLALLFSLHFPEVAVLAHRIPQRLPSRLVAADKLQFAALIAVQPLDPP